MNRQSVGFFYIHQINATIQSNDIVIHTRFNRGKSENTFTSELTTTKNLSL